MRKALTVLLLCLTVFVYGQKTKKLNFDIADFNRKAEIAEWLYQYDMVAWRTSDSVMAQDKKEIGRLGQEWFCFQQNGNWHAAYGKYTENRFDLVFHFKLDSTGKISRSYEIIDTVLLNKYARALQTAAKKIVGLKDTITVRLNQYIKENKDKTLSVWFFPAFQSNGVAVYGGEFIYTIDETGNRILKDDSYFQGQFRGFKVDKPREIWINYRETEKPTLGAVFFVWYYKSYFTNIYIDNAKSTTTAMKLDNGWTWVHAEKEAEGKKGKK